MVVCSFYLREIFGNNVERALPQIARVSKHVCFVHQGHMLTLALHGKFKCVTHTTLYTHACIRAALRCYFVWCTAAQYATFANIWAFSVFTNHNKIVDCSFSWGNAHERTLVHIQVELETHLQQQPTFNDARGYIGGAHSAQQDGVEVAQLLEHGVGQDFPVAQIALPAKVEIGCFNGHARGAHHL